MFTVHAKSFKGSSCSDLPYHRYRDQKLKIHSRHERYRWSITEQKLKAATLRQPHDLPKRRLWSFDRSACHIEDKLRTCGNCAFFPRRSRPRPYSILSSTREARRVGRRRLAWPVRTAATELANSAIEPHLSQSQIIDTLDSS